MNDNTCNGWKNYPTWCVALWLSEYGYSIDDFWSTRQCQDAKELLDYCSETASTDCWQEKRDLSETIRELADSIAQAVDGLQEAFAVNAPGMFSDLLNFSISQVDWCEIAENWLSDCEV